jgi:hypothetical protein
MTPRIVAMVEDPSWDVMPVPDPDLPARKREKVFDRAYLKDPVGVAEPVYQYRDREQVVAPSSLDQPSRELLLRAQKAIAVAVGGEAAAIEPDGLVLGARCCGMNERSPVLQCNHQPREPIRWPICAPSRLGDDPCRLQHPEPDGAGCPGEIMLCRAVRGLSRRRLVMTFR